MIVEKGAVDEVEVIGIEQTCSIEARPIVFEGAIYDREEAKVREGPAIAISAIVDEATAVD